MDFPWRIGQSVSAVLDAHRSVMVDAGIVDSGPGFDTVDIQTAEARIGRALPEDVLQLYRSARPRFASNDKSPGLRLFQLHDPDVRWYHLAKERPHPLDFEFYSQLLANWDTAEGFMLGDDFSFGRLFWLKSAPGQTDGALLVTEWQDERIRLPIVARSLAEYLGRIAYLLSLDPAARKYDAADIVQNPPEHIRLVAGEFTELNPLSTYKDAIQFALHEESAFQVW